MPSKLALCAFTPSLGSSKEGEGHTGLYLRGRRLHLLHALKRLREASEETNLTGWPRGTWGHAFSRLGSPISFIPRKPRYLSHRVKYHKGLIQVWIASKQELWDSMTVRALDRLYQVLYLFIYLFIYMNIWSACMSVYDVCTVSSTVRREMSGALELGSQNVVSHCVDSGN